MRARLALVAAPVAAIVLAACGGGGSPSAPPTAPTATPLVRPDLVVVLTDDLDVPSYQEMPRLRDVLAAQGLSFTHACAAQPLCAPSRASILTGQYSHSHGVIGNHPPNGGWPAFRRHEQATIATWLKAVGYRTSLVGKYLNDYPKNASAEYIPPGWDDWYGHLSAIEDGRYFNYWVNDNGRVSRFGAKQEDYSVDRDTARAVQFIHDSAGRPEPLFLYVAPEAPHTPADYVNRHSSEFRYALAPRVPSFNESDVSDKPSWVRQIPYMTDAQIDNLDRFQRKRLRSMSAVEDMVNAILAVLVETRRIDSTYLFFSSDNGLLMGQHRVAGLKGSAYEESIHVPLVVRGPGVRVGTVDEPVLNVDLPATLLDLAGASIPDSVEGRSLAPFLRGAPPSSWRTELLIEDGSAGFSGSLRTADWLFNHEGTQELELYDMHADRYQMQSLHRSADPALLDSLEQRMRTLLACHGVGCR
jgi:arylsulfatase A-like enzyme